MLPAQRTPSRNDYIILKVLYWVTSTYYGVICTAGPLLLHVGGEGGEGRYGTFCPMIFAHFELNFRGQEAHDTLHV
jgi:hypothetical protein